jgi:SAM-dependent methyltransferase
MSAQDEINGRLYGRSDLVALYDHAHLWPPEATVLVRYRDDIVDRPVLDLGCGAGRVTMYLRPLTRAYVGVDISRHMIDHCRHEYPDVAFFEADMRSLARFGAGTFAAMFALSSVIDAVSHEDRLTVLAEVRRVMMPGGLIVFNAHNRRYRDNETPPALVRSRNPFTQLRCAADYVMAQANRHRIRRHQRHEEEYALLNDSGHNFSVLHYYIDRPAQVRQLTSAGFRVVECLDPAGRTMGDDDDDCDCLSIYYVARRA